MEQNLVKEPFLLKNGLDVLINKELVNKLWEIRGEKFHLGDRRQAEHMSNIGPYSIKILNPKKWSKRKALGLGKKTVLVLFNTPEKEGNAYYFNSKYMENFIKDRMAFLASLENPPSKVEVLRGLI